VAHFQDFDWQRVMIQKNRAKPRNCGEKRRKWDVSAAVERPKVSCLQQDGGNPARV